MKLSSNYSNIPVGRVANNDLNVDLVGDWDSLRVSYDGNTLDFRSSDESQGAEGYNFTMKREGDVFVTVREETSYSVPGSEVLWLLSMGYQDWDQAKGHPGPIPADRIEQGLRKMIEDEKSTLDFSSDSEGEVPGETPMG